MKVGLRYRDLPTKRKLMLVILFTSSVALLVAGAVFTAYDVVTARTRLADAALSQTQILALNSRAALAFDDPKAAAETLSALAIRPSVQGVCIYSKDGRIFARYERAGAAPQFPQSPGRDGVRFENSDLVVSQAILLDQQRIGTIYLQQDVSEIYDRLRLSAGVAALVLLVSLVAAFGVSSLLQGVISKPILELAATARTVSEKKDYSARAVKRSQDELGVLVDGFNEMLAQVQARDTEIRKLNAELELRVKERTAQLEAANKELEAFAYSVSHDLRAPLRAVEGFSHIIAEKYAPKLDETGQDYLRRVRAATQRMGLLIDDMLLLSRVTRGELQREPVDLSSMAQTIAAELARREPERQVEFVIAPGVMAEGDARLLRIVLENLLDNAWKFTSKRDKSRIEFGTKSIDGKPAYFVCDNGAGFDTLYAGRLFGAFQRLHSTAEFPGTGIGLATAQRIVHRHGGRIWAEGAVNKGATFYFTV
ncbi:MAG TPA: CHASE sensor domain-containing protein [Planctomycetota bacterium]|jgi:signal transduction histidine kinase